MKRVFSTVLATLLLVAPLLSLAQSDYATTSLSLSICGNSVVDAGEQCDIPGETGVYSQTILGRQCTAACLFGPYCGDGILQTSQTEECDDGNNDSGDFCSAICKVEPAGSGGGGSSGGGGGGGGGSTKELGKTQVNISGRAYPSRTINFILDSENVGSAQTNSSGVFQFTTESSPGTATLGVWANDITGVRSITLSNTFDVTQGAVTNLNDIILPPSIKVSKTSFNPGEVLTVSGQAVPNATINLYTDRNVTTPVATGQSGANGVWSIQYDTSRLSRAEHTIRARSVTGTPPLTIQSSFSNTVQLFVGVNGRDTTPSDLSRDGKINLIDFSILIFWWNTNGGDSNPPADINGNARVGLEDFSILLFNWTG
jgi:cysteine-rich repeat protein